MSQRPSYEAVTAVLREALADFIGKSNTPEVQEQIKRRLEAHWKILPQLLGREDGGGGA